MKASRLKLAQLIAKRSLQTINRKRFNYEIAAYLMAENRINELDSLLRDVQAIWASHGIIDVVAQSARPLSPVVKSEIKDQIKLVYPQSRQLVFTHQSDPSIIGGVCLQLPGKQLDLSVRAKLDRFRQLTTVGRD